MANHEQMTRDIIDFSTALEKSNTVILPDHIFGQLYLDSQNNPDANSILREYHLNKWIKVKGENDEIIFDIPPRSFLYDTTPVEEITSLLDMARHVENWQPGLGQGDNYIAQASDLIFTDKNKLEEQIEAERRIWEAVKERYSPKVETITETKKTLPVPDILDDDLFDDDL